MDGKRIIGIDYGSKRVGVAVSDPTGKLALPLTVLTSDAGLPNKVIELAGKYDSKVIVLGESRDYSGKPNEIHEAASAFKSMLESKGFHVVFEPEFMTSIQAERLQGKNSMTDASAAALILQSYMDRASGAESLERVGKTP
ncbi:MAG: pre-16S rRNA-processing nuclease YqgF [Patescibacteria group bacterium]|nr:pre-16S rRNA-processing nuclease YqgF [Patescibacteria group bacterium]